MPPILVVVVCMSAQEPRQPNNLLTNAFMVDIFIMIPSNQGAGFPAPVIGYSSDFGLLMLDRSINGIAPLPIII